MSEDPRSDDIRRLRVDCDEARRAFRAACREPDISRRDFDLVKAHYESAMRALHRALGYE